MALTIDTASTPAEARSLLVRGTAAIEIVGGVPTEYIAASGKSLDDAQHREFEEHVRGIYSQMASISITPGWARFYAFGEGRLPKFRRNLTSENPPK